DFGVFGTLIPERAAAVVRGVAHGCEQAGCALLGGETAEHPGHLGPDDFDLAGAATGVVEADALLGPDRVRPGDAVLALASSGLHANGYSLVRRGIGGAGLALGGGPAGRGAGGGGGTGGPAPASPPRPAGRGPPGGPPPRPPPPRAAPAPRPCPGPRPRARGRFGPAKPAAPPPFSACSRTSATS